MSSFRSVVWKRIYLSTYVVITNCETNAIGVTPTLLHTSLTTALLLQLFAAVSHGRSVLPQTPANVQQVLLGPCVELVSYTPIYYHALWLKLLCFYFSQLFARTVTAITHAQHQTHVYVPVAGQEVTATQVLYINDICNCMSSLSDSVYMLFPQISMNVRVTLLVVSTTV